MMEALAMGEYGVYVWSCFGMTLLVMIITVWQAKAHQNKVYNDIEQRLKAMEEAK